MKKVSINTWNKHQKCRDKHRRYQNSDSGENTHALIIAQKGLHF
jgi:hypothetical protein